jgi:hypothetical protein
MRISIHFGVKTIPCILIVTMLLILPLLTTACSPKEPKITPQSTTMPTMVSPTSTLIPTPANITINTPSISLANTPTITLAPEATVFPQELINIVGAWQGLTVMETEINNRQSQKVVEIKLNCRTNPSCLDVLQGGSYYRFAEIPFSSINNGTICFTLPEPAIWYYSACLTLNSDGTLDYFASGPLWSEHGTLSKMEPVDAEKLKTTINSPCRAVLPPRLYVVSMARVAFTDGKPLNVRSSPGLDEPIFLKLPEGSEFTVFNGPICEDGYWWWWISTGDHLGSVAEGNSEGYFIELSE